MQSPDRPLFGVHEEEDRELNVDAIDQAMRDQMIGRMVQRPDKLPKVDPMDADERLFDRMEQAAAEKKKKQPTASGS